MRRTLAALVALLTLAVVPARAATTNAQKCIAVKTKEVTKYETCLFKAYTAQTLKSLPAPNLEPCATKLAEAWAKIETKYAAACPTLGGATSVRDDAFTHAAGIRQFLRKPIRNASLIKVVERHCDKRV